MVTGTRLLVVAVARVGGVYNERRQMRKYVATLTAYNSVAYKNNWLGTTMSGYFCIPQSFLPIRFKN